MGQKFSGTDLPDLESSKDTTAVRKAILDLLDKINQIGSTVDQLLTFPASPFAGFLQSGSNANGSYIKYADGTMMQWGRQTIMFTTGTATIQIPTPFVSTDYQIFISNSVLFGSWWYYLHDDDGGNPKYGRRTVSVFQVQGFAATGAAPPGPSINGQSLIVPFYAVGRWK